MYENVFKRLEEKYLLTKDQKELFLKEVEKYLKKDQYYKSTIHNIYFDTINHDLIINSLDKPIFKEKIRLRSYGIPTLTDDVFFEIKGKYCDMVGKRRIKIKLNEFYKYIKYKKYNKNDQIMREIDYYFNYYNLVPAIYIAYDRESYLSKEDKNLRITLDNNLRSRNNNLKLELGDEGNKYFKDDYYIMEIKTLDAMPLWLVNCLSKLKIYPISFSKYGKIYEKENIETRNLIYA